MRRRLAWERRFWLFAGAAFLFACSKPIEQAAPVEKSAWLTDFAQAKKLAAERGRPILANFEGSDWCPPCMMLEKEVFARKNVREFGKKKLVLLSVDFPRRKEQPEALRKQNSDLQQQFHVDAFPTLVLLDATGKEIGRTVGYEPGEAAAYIQQLRNLFQKAVGVKGKKSGLSK
jgi:thioredoxin-related protein